MSNEQPYPLAFKRHLRGAQDRHLLPRHIITLSAALESGLVLYNTATLVSPSVLVAYFVAHLGNDKLVPCKAYIYSDGRENDEMFFQDFGFKSVSVAETLWLESARPAPYTQEDFTKLKTTRGH